jgi:hypothetical protein
LRLDTYNDENQLGIFANLQWNLKKIYSLVLGYKSTPTSSAETGNRNTLFIKNSLQF